MQMWQCRFEFDFKYVLKFHFKYDNRVLLKFLNIRFENCEQSNLDMIEYSLDFCFSCYSNFTDRFGLEGFVY